MWFPNRSDTNRSVQLQKQARSLKFWSQVEEELYYPSSENKGADQLRGNREADLRLCFRLCRLLVFQRGGSYNIIQITAYMSLRFPVPHRRLWGYRCPFPEEVTLLSGEIREVFMYDVSSFLGSGHCGGDQFTVGIAQIC